MNIVLNITRISFMLMSRLVNSIHCSFMNLLNIIPLTSRIFSYAVAYTFRLGDVVTECQGQCMLRRDGVVKNNISEQPATRRRKQKFLSQVPSKNNYTYH